MSPGLPLNRSRLDGRHCSISPGNTRFHMSQTPPGLVSRHAVCWLVNNSSGLVEGAPASLSLTAIRLLHCSACRRRIYTSLPSILSRPRLQVTTILFMLIDNTGSVEWRPLRTYHLGRLFSFSHYEHTIKSVNGPPIPSPPYTLPVTFPLMPRSRSHYARECFMRRALKCRHYMLHVRR